MTDIERDISITTLADGAAVDLIDEALEAAWDNINDPNTPAKAKRKIVLEITLIPDEQREVVIAHIGCQKRFANDVGVVSKILLGVSGGQVVASEWVSRQTDLEEYADNVRPIDSAKEGKND